MKSFAYAVLGAASALYLSNLGAGVIELAPDNLPLVGNLDEAVATLLLLRSLGHFGFGPLKQFKAQAPNRPVERS